MVNLVPTSTNSLRGGGARRRTTARREQRAFDRDRARDHRRIGALAEEAGAEGLVVGLPLALNGSVGRAAQGALAEADELAGATGLPVERWDERLTTVTGDRDLMALDMKADARRRVVDKVAAAIMLQAWLDHRRLTSPEEPSQ